VISAQHAAAIARNPATRLKAVWSRDRERAESATRESRADVCADLDLLLARPDIQAVAVCTPSGLHAPHALRALEAGKHVLVEKPLALTLADADRMIETARRRQRLLGVVYQNRFAPAVRAAKAAMDAGRYGRLVLGSVSVKWYRTQAYYEVGGWRGTRAMDGGVLMNQAIHTLDLLQWLMGPVESVRAYASTLGHTMEAEDVAVAALRFQSGALGIIEATTCAFPGLSVRLEIHGTQGSVLLEDGRERLACFAGPGEDIGMFGRRPPEMDRPLATPAPAMADNYAALLLDFVEAISAGRAPAVDGSEGRKSLALVRAISEAAREGCPQRVVDTGQRPAF